VSRAGKGAILAVLMAIVVASWIAFYAPRGSGPSTLSPSPNGWLAARKYLAARGAEIILLDHQLDSQVDSQVDSQADTQIGQENPQGEAGGEILVTGFPWSSAALQADPEPYRTFAEAGGTLIVAYSGEVPRGVEERFMTHFDVAPLRSRGKTPWGYRGWRRWQTENWELTPNPELSGAPPTLSIRPPAAVPRAPTAAQSWFHAPAGRSAGALRGQEKPSDRRQLVDNVLEEMGAYIIRPLADQAAVIFAVPTGAGQVIWLPADLFSNGRLGEAGNAGLLESLLAGGATRWSFDEYHHGLRPPGERATPVPQRVFDLFLAHGLVLYLLALWFFARRFGPVWREPTVQSGSTADLLRGLGTLHGEMNHHRAAGDLLVTRVQQLEATNPALSSALAELEPATHGPSLVKLAHHVERIRREHGSLSH